MSDACQDKLEIRLDRHRWSPEFFNECVYYFNLADNYHFITDKLSECFNHYNTLFRNNKTTILYVPI